MHACICTCAAAVSVTYKRCAYVIIRGIAIKQRYEYCMLHLDNSSMMIEPWWKSMAGVHMRFVIFG